MAEATSSATDNCMNLRQCKHPCPPAKDIHGSSKQRKDRPNTAPHRYCRSLANEQTRSLEKALCLCADEGYEGSKCFDVVNVHDLDFAGLKLDNG